MWVVFVIFVQLQDTSSIVFGLLCATRFVPRRIELGHIIGGLLKCRYACVCTLVRLFPPLSPLFSCSFPEKRQRKAPLCVRS